MTEKILIVDDDRDLLEGVRDALAARGYSVSAAYSGEEALAAVEADPPDLILLDVMMPKMSGFEVCRRLKESAATRDIPVLLLTALHESRDRIAGLDAGADDFVTKPYHDAELLARVRAFLRSKRLHDRLKEAHGRLKELEGLRDALVHAAVHDLRGPVTYLSACLEIMKEGVIGGRANLSVQEQARMLETAARNCQEIMAFTETMLQVSRMDQRGLPVRKTELDVGALLRECAGAASGAARANGVELALDVVEGPPKAQADGDLLRRVVNNLLGNALRFTPRGGRIELGARHLAGEGRLECWVRDTGTGIPAADLERVFDKFYQVDAGGPSRRGFGLGLTFCRLAVEAHGGTIRAESEPGKGSRFVILLPL